MLVEFYIFFEVIVIGLFFTAFFTKQEILWAITATLSSVLMYFAYNVEYYVYQFNVTTGAYYPVAISNSYPYLMGINLVFLSLAMLLGIFDLFSKYGINLWKSK